MARTYTHDNEYSDANSQNTAAEHDNGQYTVITVPTPVVYNITHFKDTDQITISET